MEFEDPMVLMGDRLFFMGCNWLPLILQFFISDFIF